MVFWDDQGEISLLRLPPIDPIKHLHNLAADEPMPSAEVDAVVERAIVGLRNIGPYRVHDRVRRSGADVTINQVARVLLAREA